MAPRILGANFVYQEAQEFRTVEHFNGHLHVVSRYQICLNAKLHHFGRTNDHDVHIRYEVKKYSVLHLYFFFFFSFSWLGTGRLRKTNVAMEEKIKRNNQTRALKIKKIQALINFPFILSIWLLLFSA